MLLEVTTNAGQKVRTKER